MLCILKELKLLKEMLNFLTKMFLDQKNINTQKQHSKDNYMWQFLIFTGGGFTA